MSLAFGDYETSSRATYRAPAPKPRTSDSSSSSSSSSELPSLSASISTSASSEVATPSSSPRSRIAALPSSLVAKSSNLELVEEDVALTSPSPAISVDKRNIKNLKALIDAVASSKESQEEGIMINAEDETILKKTVRVLEEMSDLNYRLKSVDDLQIYLMAMPSEPHETVTTSLIYIMKRIGSSEGWLGDGAYFHSGGKIHFTAGNRSGSHTADGCMFKVKPNGDPELVPSIVIEVAATQRAKDVNQVAHDHLLNPQVKSVIVANLYCPKIPHPVRADSLEIYMFERDRRGHPIRLNNYNWSTTLTTLSLSRPLPQLRFPRRAIFTRTELNTFIAQPNVPPALRTALLTHFGQQASPDLVVPPVLLFEALKELRRACFVYRSQ